MKSVAVLIPCYNEEYAIAYVVKSFRKVLPEARIYVYDNDSEDNTEKIAKSAGAEVIKVKDRGKGNVVRRMFADIDADTYIMIDGDSTYDVEDAPKILRKMETEKADMVVAVRKPTDPERAYPCGHQIGNKFFNFVLKTLFNSTFHDIFSGYRGFTRRFVKTFPVVSTGFDIEAELSIHALTLGVPFAEIESKYSERPLNSHSKLSTFKDGIKILRSIIRLLRETRPLLFFGMIALFLFILSSFWGIPIIRTFLKSGQVPRLPTAVLSAGTMIISSISLICGLLLDSTSQFRMEVKKLHFLGFRQTE